MIMLGVLYFGAVLGFFMWVRLILWLCWFGVLEDGEGFFYVAGHGAIACACVVVPFEVHAEESVSSPIFGDFVSLFE